ncbi:hypothetical protein N7468_009174 [Penicillium chermesinum]|uniref:Uncharacterized protein n=1 Tax=Penicillium chermesinum TaxID=63820 RepID=A0A9W9NH98_9EURO|nr:uncharacterized protein N7468_009174 [Penicillium chermesinum]KAJ5219970.1 hypothetical protein N7468_009174 [Penicillium chermesinum]
MSLKRSHSQWPEGIPSFIRQHKEPVEWKDIDAATRAWRHFVRERWVGGDTADQQKRDLIEQWATADQEFRDGYQSRAPEDEPSFFDGPEMKALLAKAILGLFPWEEGWEFYGEEMVMFLPLEGNQDILETFKLQQSVARPHFLDMHMALDGTVLFKYCGPNLIIDDRTLETGLGLWVEFDTNGVYRTAYRVQIMSSDHADLYRYVGPGNQKPLWLAFEYIESYYYPNLPEDRDLKLILEDKPVDMRKAIVDIYMGGDVNLVDEYAPGFREAEEAGNGLAIGFDLRGILANDGSPLKIIDYERP